MIDNKPIKELEIRAPDGDIESTEPEDIEWEINDIVGDDFSQRAETRIKKIIRHG